jgi:putative peptide zinc metalloprotease protein
MALDLSVALPRLRRDLVRRTRTDAAGAAHVIKDPVSGEFFRLQEVEGFVAEQLDGGTSLERVTERVAQKFGAPLAENALTAFIEQLDRAGLLENERGTRARQGHGLRRFAGGLLNARLKLVNPERFLNALAPRVGFFYTRAFAYLSAATIVMAGMIGVLNWDSLAGEMSGLLRLSAVPLLIATIFTTITLHELAHGLTCKRFGGEVRDMGFMFLYLQPAFYCNVSDAWLFPEKHKRLLVGFAGPYFELFVWALAMLAWRVTDVGTWIGQVAVVVMATSGVKTLFNFNPLIKLDGYYLLSDYLDVPNLRRRSFAYFGDYLRRLWRWSHPLPAVSAREHRIYLAYGATAWLCSASLLGYVGLSLSEVLIAEGQRVGFIALAGLLGFRFRSKFARLFGRRASVDDDAATSTSESKPPKKKSSKGKRRWRKALRVTLKLAGVGAIVALLYVGRMELRVAGPIDVRPHHNADVRTGIAGIVEEIYVEEGQHVVTGDPIARLSDQATRAELEKTKAEIREVRAKLAELTAGPTDVELEVARLAVVTAQDRLEFATAKRARTEELFQRQLVSNQDFDVARELETTAVNALGEAQGKLDVLLEGTRPEQIAAAEAETARLDAQRQYLEQQLELMNVLSPADGMVTTPNRQLRELLRQLLPKGGLIAEVHELDVITVEAAIPEKEIADVEVGQRVAVKARAYPERLFHGKVIAIGTTTQQAAAAAFASGASSVSTTPSNGAGTTIRVITEIDNESGLLKPGMTGMAKIYCGERRFTDLIVRRLSRTFRVEFWSWW